MFTFMYDHIRTPPKAQIIRFSRPPSTEAHKAQEGVWHTPFNLFLSAFKHRTVLALLEARLAGPLELLSKRVLSGC